MSKFSRHSPASAWHVCPWWGGQWTVVDLECGVPEGIWEQVWGRSRSPSGFLFMVIRDMIRRPPPSVYYRLHVYLVLDVNSLPDRIIHTTLALPFGR